MRILAVVALVFMTAVNLAAVDVSFEGLDLSNDDRLLFRATVHQPGWGPYGALFSTDLQDGGETTALTCFPERFDWFPDTGEAQIHNRFGLYRLSLAEGTLRRIGFHPSFAGGDTVRAGRVLPVATSPDGRWVVVQESAGGVRADLVLYEVATDRRIIVSTDAVIDHIRSPVTWSPDSNFFLYSKDGVLYYVALRHVNEQRLPAEHYREFGRGTLRSVRWAGDDILYYVEDTLVSRIRSTEFFTRSFYTAPLRPGDTAGTLPVPIDPHFDHFWPAPDGRSLLLLKEERNLFLFPLIAGAEADDGGTSLPYLLLPRGWTVLQVWWKSDGRILLLAGDSHGGDVATKLYRLNTKTEAKFTALPDEGIRRFVPAPNGAKIAWLTADGVSLRDGETLKVVGAVSHPDPRDLFWLPEGRLLLAGGEGIESVDPETDTRELLMLSKPGVSGFDADGGTRTLLGERPYVKESLPGRWAESPDFFLRPPRTESDDFRVFLEGIPNNPYANRIMVRNTTGYGTRPLFSIPESRREPYPEAGDDTLPSSYDDRVFDHGSRQRLREVALVFNAIDTDEGLDGILDTLADYDLRVTFFVGGDFIRRHPDAARMLAESGHEIGSLFYTHMDMTDMRYRIDEDFVARGLARNEDEFYRATGAEVSTFWHAPWYVLSPPILDATREMNYLYVGRDVDTLDWVALDAPGGTRDLYRSATELVERILELKKPGSIIPVRVGKPGRREDYLFKELDILINGLLEQGYDIVPVSVLRDHAQ